MMKYSSPKSPVAFAIANDDLPTLPLWALALGVLSLLTLGLTSLPAIICGHRALAATNRPESKASERRVAATGLISGYVGAALLGTWIMLLANLLHGH
jgi:hypothetical protein